jgi:hypothetical protein
LTIAGAEIVDMLSVRLDAASLVTTANIKFSMPAKLPWLSKAGVVIRILKFAKGAIVM